MRKLNNAPTHACTVALMVHDGRGLSSPAAPQCRLVWWQRRGRERGRASASEGPIGGAALAASRGEDLVAAFEQVLLQLGQDVLAIGVLAQRGHVRTDLV